MRERLLRFARNDRIRAQWPNDKAHSPCHCEGSFPKQSARFHKGELVAAMLRQENLFSASFAFFAVSHL